MAQLAPAALGASEILCRYRVTAPVFPYSAQQYVDLIVSNSVLYRQGDNAGRRRASLRAEVHAGL